MFKSPISLLFSNTRKVHIPLITSTEVIRSFDNQKDQTTISSSVEQFNYDFTSDHDQSDNCCIDKQEIIDNTIINDPTIWKITKLIENNKPNEAIQYYEEMKKEGKEMDNDKKIKIYNTILKGFLNTEKIKESKDWLSKMKTLALLDIETYNILITNHFENEEYESIHSLYKEIINNKAIQPNAKTFYLLFRCYSKQSNMLQLEYLFNHLRSENINADIDLYHLFLRTFFRKGKISCGLLVYKEIINNEFELSSDTFNLILHGLSSNCQFDRIEYFWYEMLDKRIRPTVKTFNILITSYARNNDLSSSLQIFEYMKLNNITPDIATYSILFHVYFCNNEVEKVRTLIRELKNLKIELNVIAYTSLIRNFAKNGYLEDSIQYLNEMKLKNIRPNATIYGIVISGYLDSNRMEEARVLLAEALCALPGNEKIKKLKNRVHWYE